MNAPERLFIDERVAGTMGRDGPPPAGDAQFVQYVRIDVAQDVMREAMGTTEFFIQIQPGPGERDLFALTNYGRLFVKFGVSAEAISRDPSSQWCEWDTPSFPAEGDDREPQ